MLMFFDGPAEGEYLECRRAPLFLRVAVREDRGVDALDQPDDVPEPGEALFAYRREGPSGGVHLDHRGGRSATLATGRYSLCPRQPPEGTMRDNALWRAWCVARAAEEAHDG